MKLISYFNSRIKLFTIWDVKLSQFCAMLLIILIVQKFPVILSISPWWFLLILFVCCLRPIYVMFLKKS